MLHLWLCPWLDVCIPYFFLCLGGQYPLWFHIFDYSKFYVPPLPLCMPLSLQGVWRPFLDGLLGTCTWVVVVMSVSVHHFFCSNIWVNIIRGNPPWCEICHLCWCRFLNISANVSNSFKWSVIGSEKCDVNNGLLIASVRSMAYFVASEFDYKDGNWNCCGKTPLCHLHALLPYWWRMFQHW